MGKTANEVFRSEKAEIIKLVKQSHQSARKTLEQIGVPRATFYRWYEQ